MDDSLTRNPQAAKRGFGHSLLCRRLPVGEREAADLPGHAPQLLAERAGVVVQPVPLADLAHLDGDLRVAPGREVREQVVLDLV